MCGTDPARPITALGFTKIAVPKARAAGVGPDVATIITDAAVAQASRASQLAVIGASDIDAMLGVERQRELLGCDNTACISEIGGALGLDAILSLSLGRLGQTYRPDATLIGIRQARPLARGNLTVRGEADELIPAVERLVTEMLAPFRT